MSEPTPEPAPAGILAHIEHWVQQHVVPELEAVKADAEKAITALPAALQSISKLTGIVTSLAKVVDPAAGPEVTAVVAEAEKVAEEIAAVAESVLSKM